MSKSIRLKNNDVIVHDWAVLATNDRRTLIPISWQYTDFSFNEETDYFSTNNNELFEFNSSGIKCKFKGAILIIQEMSLANNVVDAEFDLVDDYGVFYQIKGTVKYLFSIYRCNKNDIKKIRYITGVSSVECYNARLFLMRIA